MVGKEKNSLQFAVPGQEEAVERKYAAEENLCAAEQRLRDGKKVTLFWVLQHYSSENFAVYRREKEREKERKKQELKPAEETQRLNVTEQKGVVPERQTPQPEGNFGPTIFINHDQAAQNYGLRPQASLDCLGFGQTVPVGRVPFRIGRLQKGVELCIEDNSAISHKHAEITYHDGSYWIKDLDSTNRTYLDDMELPAQREFPLKDGSKLVLGNEAFVFHVNG